ncbi:MAG: hypothetical protein H5T73_09740 [Actinobacteria bacterium]|nr:hypothetical protein [Actinomycetota bacterium]
MSGKSGTRVPPMAGFGNLSRLRKALLYLALLPSFLVRKQGERRASAGERRDARHDLIVQEEANLEEI